MSYTNRDYAIHVVSVNKKVPFDVALQHFHNIVKTNSKNFYTETKNNYKFRNIPKTKFIKSSYRTKKINKDISIIFGELKPEFQHLSGAGLFDFGKKTIQYFKDAFKPSYKYNNISTKTLNNYGGKTIISMSVYRTPIQNFINLFLNLISLGKFNEAKSKYNFDKLFHLALVCVVDGKNIIVQKNEVVDINTNFKITDDTETMPVSLGGRNLTLNEILNKTKDVMGHDLFFQYNSYNNNCQIFIQNILNSNNLNTPLINNFVKQDTEELLNELPKYNETISKFITDTGAVFSRLIGKSSKKAMK